MELDKISSYSIYGQGQEEYAWKKWSVDKKDFTATKTSAVVKKVIGGSWKEHYIINNGLLKVTFEHPILTKDGETILWKKVEDLKLGDYIYSVDGWVKIKRKDLISNN